MSFSKKVLLKTSRFTRVTHSTGVSLKLINNHFFLSDGPMKTDLGCHGLRGSEITLYGEIPAHIPLEKQEKMHPRTKLKTNGHFTSFMQVR